MKKRSTTHTGPLGSTVHVLHAGEDTVAALAAIDRSRHFRRVCLDPIPGVVVPLTPP